MKENIQGPYCAVDCKDELGVVRGIFFLYSFKLFGPEMNEKRTSVEN